MQPTSTIRPHYIFFIRKKLLAQSEGSSIVFEAYPKEYTFKKSRGLCELGITPSSLQKIQLKIAAYRKKEEIEVVSIDRDDDYMHIHIKVNVLGETIRTTLTSLHPLLQAQRHGLADEMDVMEESGMRWATAQKLYPEEHLGVLSDTYCSGLVHVCYPEHMKFNGLPIDGGFTKEQLAFLDKWMRALFANDEERDDFELFETASAVRADNSTVMKGLKKHIETDSAKIRSMRQILESSCSPGKIPDYFYTSLAAYQDSTATEASYQESLSWPDVGILDGVKGVSSGSYHAFDAGAMLLGLDREALSKSSYLDFLAKFSATSVESHNDVLSHAKETRTRLEKLRQILIHIDLHYTTIEPHLEKSDSEIDKLSDKNLQYLIRFCKKIKEKGTQRSFDSLNTDRALINLLDIIPSFNHIDANMHRYPQTTIQEAYDRTATKGNDAIRACQKHIKLFNEAIRDKTLLFPSGYDNTEEEGIEFIRQARLWVNICQGWDAHSLWALAIKRYNVGITSQDTPGTRIVKLLEMASA